MAIISCPKCQAKLSERTSVCPACGWNVLAPKPPKRRSRDWLFWGGFLALLAVGLLGAWLLQKPYSIIQRTEGPGGVAYQVRVPADASDAQMTAWGQELAEKAGSKYVQVNFYLSSEADPINLIGSYQGGTFYRTN